jgi:tRNA pseudouridine55 synthase
MFGVVLIDKPTGFTSHDAVAVMRKRFNTKRIGHAGTLDPLATGLLVMAIGPATRFLNYLPLEPKEYVCRYRFGMTTNTFDAEGEPTPEQPLPADLAGAIRGAIPLFLGEIQQLPPMYSAVKKGGKPLYVYARKGEEVEREYRTVTIEEYDILSIGENTAEFRVVCSGGTYVRTLAHDMGQALGCGAYLDSLRRTAVGGFSVDAAAPLTDSGPDDIIPLSEALSTTPQVRLNFGQVERIRHGNPVRVADAPAEGTVALADSGGFVIGLGRADGGWLHPEIVVPLEALGDAD